MDSKTADAARHAAAARHRRNWFSAGFGVGVLGGLVLWAKGSSDHSDLESRGGQALLIAGGVCAIAAVVEGLVTNEQMESVVYYYDRELAQELRVCTNGFRIVPCESPAMAEPPPMIPDPSIGTLRQR